MSVVCPLAAEAVQEILSQLREEVKEMAKTNWMYEGDDDAAMRIKV